MLAKMEEMEQMEHLVNRERMGLMVPQVLQAALDLQERRDSRAQRDPLVCQELLVCQEALVRKDPQGIQEYEENVENRVCQEEEVLKALRESLVLKESLE